MAAIINTGISYIAQQQGGDEPVLLTGFVLANISGLDFTQEVNLNETLPIADDIVFQSNVTQSGFITPNRVAYSLLMGADIGDFDFNWMGLLSDDGTLVAVAYLPLVQKRKTQNGITGTTVTRNFILEFNNAQSLTGLTIDASTWQYSFEERFNLQDELWRRSNLDIYGDSAFFGNSFSVIFDDGIHFLEPGVAYIRGIRIELDKSISFPVDTSVSGQYVFLDAYMDASADGAKPMFNVVAATSYSKDYIDSAGIQHFVELIWELDTEQDRRVVFNWSSLFDHNHDDRYAQLSADNYFSRSQTFGGMLTEFTGKNTEFRNTETVWRTSQGGRGELRLSIDRDNKNAMFTPKNSDGDIWDNNNRFRFDMINRAWVFDQTPKVDTHNIWHAGNFDPNAKADLVNPEFSGRPSVDTHTVWHAGNFEPEGKADIDSPNFQGIPMVNTHTIWHNGNLEPEFFAPVNNPQLFGEGSFTGEFNVDGTLTINGEPVGGSSGFTEDKGVFGYTILPNGIILQWGIAIIGNDFWVDVNYPIAFTSSHPPQVVATVEQLASSTTGYATTFEVSTNNFRLKHNQPGQRIIRWFAIGY